MGLWYSTRDTTEDTGASTSQDCLKPKFEDKYVTIATLGRGAFGIVKKVKDKKTDVVYAVKEIRIEGYDPDCVQKEIDSQKMVCEHVNVVKLLNVYKEPTIVHILLEFCELGNLSDFVGKTPIPKGLKFLLMCDMADGLDFLHEKKIIHRDIKPENILLVNGSFRPRCKIADFGLAKHLDSFRGSYKTDSGCGNYMNSQVGTLKYIAPEVLKGRYEKGCDIFSLGVVFYILFTTSTSGDGTELMPAINTHMLHETVVTEKDIERILKKHKPKKMGKTISMMLKKDYHQRIDCRLVIIKLKEIYDKLQNQKSKVCVLC